MTIKAAENDEVLVEVGQIWRDQGGKDWRVFVAAPDDAQCILTDARVDAVKFHLACDTVREEFTLQPTPEPRPTYSVANAGDLMRDGHRIGQIWRSDLGDRIAVLLNQYGEG